MADFIQITVITTGDDLTERFNLNQPLRVVFNQALKNVGGGSHREEFTLQYGDTELALDQKIGDAAAQLVWGDHVELELLPRPVVV